MLRKTNYPASIQWLLPNGTAGGSSSAGAWAACTDFSHSPHSLKTRPIPTSGSLTPPRRRPPNFGVDALNIPFHDPLKGTNPQYAQDGENLYICGGYGKDATTGDFITFPVLTAVNLPQTRVGDASPHQSFGSIPANSVGSPCLWR